MQSDRTKNLIYTALFAALYVIGTYLRIPFYVVPLVLTNLFVLLGGYVLGPLWGMASVLLYLFLGAIGLPIFSAGGGVAMLVGPTGGYLFGYLIAAASAGLARKWGGFKLWTVIPGVIISDITLYLTGVPWLKRSLDISWSKALSIGFIPFLIGDGVKIAVAVILIRSLHRYTPQLLANCHD